MAWVADYTHRIAPADLRAAGVVGVCRYLSYPVPSGKVIGRAEYDELVAAGFHVVLNWEYDARDWLGGASAGAAHGKEAARQAKALGHPAGRPLPGSADLDMTWAQWTSYGRPYALAYRNAVHDGGYDAGAYGHTDLLGWCYDLGGFGLLWQSMSTAFAAGRNATRSPLAHLWQRRRVTVAGQQVDYNDILQSDWWGASMSTLDTNMPAVQDLLYRVESIHNLKTASGGPSADTNALRLKLQEILLQAQSNGGALSDIRTILGSVTLDSIMLRLDAIEQTVAALATPTVDAAALGAALAGNTAFVDALAGAVATDLAARLAQ